MSYPEKKLTPNTELTMWEKNKKYYAKAIDLHQRYGYGSRRIAYVIPVHERTIRRWFTKFAQENVRPQQTMNAKKT